VPSFAADNQYDKFWKIMVLAGLISGLMFTRHRLHQIALVISVTLGFYMAKEGLIFLLTAGGHHVEGSSATGDNNGLALAILMIIPLLLYAANYTADRWIRLGMYITAVLGAVTVVASYSRGGFIGLLALGVMLLKGSRHKFRGLILVYSSKNDKLRPGTPEIGFFRMSEPKQRKIQETPVRQLRGRNL